MNNTHICCVIAHHENDVSKQIIANKIAAIADGDPHWKYNVYTEENWSKLKNAQDEVTAWSECFACSTGFAYVISDFNKQAPVYPRINAEHSLIDAARLFMTIVVEEIDPSNERQQLDLLESTAAPLGLSPVD